MGSIWAMVWEVFGKYLGNIWEPRFPRDFAALAFSRQWPVSAFAPQPFRAEDLPMLASSCWEHIADMLPAVFAGCGLLFQRRNDHRNPDC